tara:strand:+ start:437 stop:601 length:165 start_codon:yes stop_codon:yes gene_type:complete
MKDIIPEMNHRLYKPEFLNRTVKYEEKRVEKYQELLGLGMRPYQAYQKSKKVKI